MLRDNRLKITLLITIAISAYLFYSNYMGYSIIVLLLAIIIFVVWTIAHKGQKNVNLDLFNNTDDVEESLDLLQSLQKYKLNNTDIDHISKLSVLDINTSFTRTYNEILEHESKKYKFIGALKVFVKATYGVDMNKIKISIPENGRTLKISNVVPRFLTINGSKFNWELYELFELNNDNPDTDSWINITELHDVLPNIIENKRYHLGVELDNIPNELSQLTSSFKKQIISSLKIYFEASGKRVEFVDSSDKKFISLEDLNSNSN